MRNILILLLINTACLATDTTTVTLYQGRFEDAVRAASKAHKGIFIDVYTSWCGPCKKMEKEAFTSPLVAAKFNPNFICLRIDAEKGEGVALAKKFNVRAYPTLLYLDSAGTLRYRVAGYSTTQQLITDCDRALAAFKKGNDLANYNKRYAAEERSLPFLQRYLVSLSKVDLPGRDILEEYVGALPVSERYKPETIDLLQKTLSTTQSKAYPVLVHYLTMENHQKGKLNEQVLMSLEDALQTDYIHAIQNRNEPLFHRYLARRRQLFSLYEDIDTNSQQNVIRFRTMNFYGKTGNMVKYKPLALKFAHLLMAKDITELRTADSLEYANFLTDIAHLPDSTRQSVIKKMGPSRQAIATNYVASDLNELVETYLLHKLTRSDLQNALSWSKRAAELTQDTHYISNHARVLNQLGYTSQAKQERNRIKSQ